MMEEKHFIDHMLRFKVPGGTSRGILTQKYSGFIYGMEDGELRGIGEVSTIPGLSVDDGEDFKVLISEEYKKEELLSKYPALQFGLETYQRSIGSADPFVLCDTSFTRGESGIPINGLIWMGDKKTMLEQVRAKLENGFSCIKLKIGAIDFEEELELLKYIRNDFGSSDIEIRVDANGAFRPEEASEKLIRLADYAVHSIEQPIKPGQWDEMAELCELGVMDIALDEELIGIHGEDNKRRLLEIIKPQYLILKPSLVGGFNQADEWINLAVENKTGWWATSALESNVGLNAIAQWLSTKEIVMPQGLGTGSLFSNNINSPLYIDRNQLWYRQEDNWDLSVLDL